jgi:outer membrane protein OmpA-like peptidoglycan-associated protein
MISRNSSDKSDVFRSFGLVVFFSFLGLITYSVALVKSEKQPSKVSNDFNNASEFLSDGIVENIKNVLKEGGIENIEIKQIYPLAKDNETERFSVSIADKDSTGDGSEKIHVGIKKSSSGDPKISEINLSKNLSSKANFSNRENIFDVKVNHHDDALFVADYFVSALRDLNYETAVSYCLPDQGLVEKIAGLCIMIEGGKFIVSQENPIEILESLENSSVLRIHLDSTNNQKTFNFTIQLSSEYQGQNSLWNINKIYLEEAFSSYFSLEDTKFPFVPVRTDLNTGDCLVVYFDFKSSELSQRSKNQLQILADVLNIIQKSSLKIYGHADEIGSQDFNMNLSIERAFSVKNFLISKGIETSKIDVYGKGESQEWLPNRLASGTDNPIGRSYNRRVEIYLD